MISKHLVNVLRPLSKETEKLLADAPQIQSTDRLNIGIQERGGTSEIRRFTFQADGEWDYEKMFLKIVAKGWWPLRNYPAKPTPSFFASEKWWRRIPGVQISQNGQKILAPITDLTVLCTLAVWGRDKIRFTSQEAELEFWTKFAGFTQYQKASEIQARFKEHGELPENAPQGNSAIPPMPHQRAAAACILACPCYSLFMEMRTGKSYSQIMAFDEDSNEHPNMLNLIVCPKNVRSNWISEIRKYTTKNVNIVVLRRHKIHRIKLLLEAFQTRKDYDYTVVITSYETLSKTKTQIAAMPGWRWGVLDESHYIKAAHRDRFKATKEVRFAFTRRTCLTGSPIVQGAFDLYSQFEWLDEGHSGFSSREEFRKFYGVWKSVGRGYEKLVGMQNLPLLQERLTRTAFLMSMKEALPDLPPVTHKILEAEMTTAQAKAYNDLATRLFAEIERDLNDEGKKAQCTVTNILTRLLRLAQVTSGYIALDGEIDLDTGEVLSREIDRFDPNPKMEVLVDYLKERPSGSKTIVWACFVQNIKQIAARLELEGIKCVTYYGHTSEQAREDAVYAFNNDPDVTVFVGNPGAGGVGINLAGRCPDENGQKRTQCDAVVYYSQGWSSAVRVQSTARPRDKNCDWSVEVVDILVLDSIDDQILERVLDKIQHARDVQDIRGILKKIVQPVVGGEDD